MKQKWNRKDSAAVQVTTMQMVDVFFFSLDSWTINENKPLFAKQKYLGHELLWLSSAGVLVDALADGNLSCGGVDTGQR